MHMKLIGGFACATLAKKGSGPVDMTKDAKDIKWTNE